MIEIAARTIGTPTDGSPEWHTTRATRVGGSDIGVVCGWSPWQTRDQLLADKLAALRGQPRDRRTTPAMQRGHLLEPAVLAWLADKHHLVIDAEASAQTWVHPECDGWLYHPDGVTTDGVLLEAKTTSDRSADRGWGRAGGSKIPLYYQAQVQWGMGVLGLTECHVGVLAGATNGRPALDFASYTIQFNQHIFDHMAGKANAFLAELKETTNE